MILCGLATPALADPQPEPIRYSYYPLEPDISSDRTLGYVRISASLMAKHTSELTLLEQHDPLLRDAILSIAGRLAKEKVTSLPGRDEIRKECLDTLNELMLRETGKKLLVDLLFTNHIFQ